MRLPPVDVTKVYRWDGQPFTLIWFKRPTSFTRMWVVARRGLVILRESGVCFCCLPDGIAVYTSMEQAADTFRQLKCDCLILSEVDGRVVGDFRNSVPSPASVTTESDVLMPDKNGWGVPRFSGTAHYFEDRISLCPFRRKGYMGRLTMEPTNLVLCRRCLQELEDRRKPPEQQPWERFNP